MTTWEPFNWQCECCSPPRQVYYRAMGKTGFWYHQHDDSKAVVNKSVSQMSLWLSFNARATVIAITDFCIRIS